MVDFDQLCIFVTKIDGSVPRRGQQLQERAVARKSTFMHSECSIVVANDERECWTPVAFIGVSNKD